MSDLDYMARVRAMERRLYRIAHAILWSDADCADAIQEAVFKGWMKRASLREESYFETWLIRILINECRSLLRRQKRLPIPMGDELRAKSAPGNLEVDLQLRAALQRLPEKYRMPLLLHHLEGYGLAEIAAMMKLRPTMVKSRLHQARGALRKILDEGEDLP